MYQFTVDDLFLISNFESEMKYFISVKNNKNISEEFT
jgi:hypothetical protein